VSRPDEATEDLIRLTPTTDRPTLDYRRHLIMALTLIINKGATHFLSTQVLIW